MLDLLFFSSDDYYFNEISLNQLVGYRYCVSITYKFRVHVHCEHLLENRRTQLIINASETIKIVYNYEMDYL